MSVEALAEVATCLWYLKTKHFKRDWDGQDGAEDDPRVRRAVGRLNKGIEALKKAGFDIQDPTNKRYQTGSEGTMRPLQFDPTPGINVPRVTQTVAPIVYLNERLIQRGEVFVAVPQETTGPSSGQSASVEAPDRIADAITPVQSDPHGAEASIVPPSAPGPSDQPQSAGSVQPPSECKGANVVSDTGEDPDKSHDA